MKIYKITNNVNNKIYIGQTTVGVANRWTDHRRYARQDNDRNVPLYYAMRKYGIENFNIEEIDSANTLEELNIKEATYIKAFNSISPNGYNLQPGGDSKACHAETKAKIAATLKGRPIKNRWTKGRSKPHSEATKAKLSKALLGRSAVQNNEAVYEVATGLQFISQKHAAEHFGVARQTINVWVKKGKFKKVQK